jgi:hypothetical protein
VLQVWQGACESAVECSGWCGDVLPALRAGDARMGALVALWVGRGVWALPAALGVASSHSRCSLSLPPPLPRSAWSSTLQTSRCPT